MARFRTGARARGATRFPLPLWLALGALLAALPVQAAPPHPCSAARVDEVQQAYQAIQSFEGRFQQHDRRGDGARVEAAGKIAYRRPGRMRWEYEPPNDQLLVTDGETVWLFDPLLDNVTVQPLKNLTQGTPLAFLLGVGNLNRDFTCRPHTTPPPADGLTYLELHPRASIPGLAYVQLGVEPKGSAIRVLRMVDTAGNVREVRFLGLGLGVTFPPDYFTFTVKEGMEVISK